jgi:hypothetical protein
MTGIGSRGFSPSTISCLIIHFYISYLIISCLERSFSFLWDKCNYMVYYLPVTVQLIPVIFHPRLLLTGNGKYFYMVALADWLRMLRYLQLEKLSSPYWFGPSLLVIPHFTPWTRVDATCLSDDSLSEWKFDTLLWIN